jgi:hypothetical protein
MTSIVCEKCRTEIDLDSNKSGLVFNDKIFVCEECCKHSSDDEIQEWSKSIMRKDDCGMPIALWLVHEQNKDKVMFSKQKP